MTEIHGFCRDDFAPVRDRFATSFTEGLERGASVAVTLHGETVVDLWAGQADGDDTPWEARHHLQRLVHHQDHGRHRAC
jgi:hypothetical protein